MRRLAIQGVIELRGIRAKRLAASSFTRNHANEIETDDREISRLLSYEYVQRRGPPTSRFFLSPFTKPSNFDLVLFRPHFMGTEVIKLDIVQIGKTKVGLDPADPLREYEVGYRFESSSRRADIHGYPHMQFTSSFQGNIKLNHTHPFHTHLPVQYPAVPIAEKSPHSRLFSALVTFAGLDQEGRIGLPRDLEKLNNTGGTAGEFDAFLREAKLTCKELSRAWNGKRGFNDGSRLGRFVDRFVAR